MYGTSEGKIVFMAGLAGLTAAYLHGRQQGRIPSKKQLAAKGFITGLGAALGIHTVATQKVLAASASASAPIVPSAESIAPYMADEEGAPTPDQMQVHNEVARLEGLIALLEEQCAEHGGTGRACTHITTLNARIQSLQQATGTQILGQGASIDWDMVQGWWENVREH